MATALDGSAEYRATSFFSATSANFTICMWLYPTDVGSAGTYRNFAGMETQITGQIHSAKWGIGTISNDFDGGTTAVANTWAHLALVRNGSGKTLYLNGVSEASGTDAATGSTTLALGDWDNSLANNDEYIGRYAAVKIWEAVLTVAEIQQEMRQMLPVRTDSLRAFYPMLSVSDDQVDFGGGARTLTVTGTPTTADGPPIPWKQGRQRILFSAAGGGSALTKDVSDAIVMAEVLSNAVGVNKADALTMADAISKATGVNKADALTMSDVRALLFGKNIADTFTLADAMALSAGKFVADTFTLTDAQILSIGKVLSDSITMADVRELLATKGFSDSITMGENLEAIITLIITLSDSFSMSDTLTRNIGITLLDSLTATDAVAKLISKAFADGLSVSDLISILSSGAGAASAAGPTFMRFQNQENTLAFTQGSGNTMLSPMFNTMLAA